MYLHFTALASEAQAALEVGRRSMSAIPAGAP